MEKDIFISNSHTLSYNERKNEETNYEQFNHKLSSFIHYTKNETSQFFMNIDQIGSTRLHRLFIFITFFLSSISLIFILSKFYNKIQTIKQRRQRYGYFISAYYEAAFFHYLLSLQNKLINIQNYIAMFNSKLKKFLNKIKMSVLKKIERHSELAQKNENVQFLKDTGHDNKVYDNLNSNEKLETTGSKIKQELMPDLSRNKRFTGIRNFFEEKRVNSFSYIRISNDCLDNNSKSVDYIDKMSTKTNSSRDTHIHKQTSISMESIQDKSQKILNRSIFKSIRKFFFSSETLNRKKNLKNTLISHEPEIKIELDLPTILVTDTAKMFTDVIDLENFHPEKNRNNNLH